MAYAAAILTSHGSLCICLLFYFIYFIYVILSTPTDSSGLQVNGETVKLGIPGAAQRMEASAKLMIPLQRVGTPEDAAGAMLMLASPYSSYISAQVLLQAPDLLCCSHHVCLLRLGVAAESCVQEVAVQHLLCAIWRSGFVLLQHCKVCICVDIPLSYRQLSKGLLRLQRSWTKTDAACNLI